MMTSRDMLELASAGLGTLGGLALAVPFYFDYKSRSRRAKTMAASGRTEVTGENIQQVFQELDKGQLNVILFPDPRMAAWSVAGCAGLVLGFIALFISKFF